MDTAKPIQRMYIARRLGLDEKDRNLSFLRVMQDFLREAKLPSQEELLLIDVWLVVKLCGLRERFNSTAMVLYLSDCARESQPACMTMVERIQQRAAFPISIEVEMVSLASRIVYDSASGKLVLTPRI